MDESELDDLLALRAELVEPNVDLKTIVKPPPSPGRWMALAAVLLVGVLGGWWVMQPDKTTPIAPIHAPSWVLLGLGENEVVRPGQALLPRIHLPGEVRPYVYLLHIGPDGKNTVLEPPPGQSPQRLMAANAEGMRELPPIKITAEPPFGQEQLALVLTQSPVASPFDELVRVRSSKTPTEGTIVLRAEYRSAP